VDIVNNSKMSAEKGKRLDFPPKGLEEFVPKVAQVLGTPKALLKVIRGNLKSLEMLC